MSSQTFPKVIVLTLNYNGKQLLDECITTYLANDYPNFEMVVIDNGSTDGSEEFVKQNYPQIKFIQTGANLGYSGGFNVGLEYAFKDKKADYALVTNNDVKADSKVISALVKAAEKDPKIGFTIGKVYYYDQPDVFQTVGKATDPVRWRGGNIGRFEKDVQQYDEPSERPFCDDIYWLVKKELYDITGGYDTTFFLQAEDADWQARAKKIGFKIFYTPEAKLWHKESMTLGKTSPLKSYYDARNPLIVVMKHRSKEFNHTYMKWYFKDKILIPSIKTAIRRFEFKKAYMMWKGYISALLWYRKNKDICFREDTL